MEQADSTRDFVALWTRNTRRIFAYVLTLLPHWADAEEVLQETSTLAWERFDQYEPGTNFCAWACRIAYYKVLEHRRRKKRDAVCFSEPLVEVIDKHFEQETRTSERRAEALRECLEKLTPRDRELIQLRYEPDATVKSVAARVDRSVDAIYKALRRIHDALFDCVQEVVGATGNR